MTRPVLRLLADDLTGALDSAAEFSALAGPVPVRWRDNGRTAGNLARATATREATRREAIDRVAASAPLLAGGDIAFKKLDSLLRGHPAAELAACLRAHAWRSVVVAPAFPAMGRVTRGGVQQARDPDGLWRAVAPPLAAQLAAEGLAARPGDPALPLPPGLSVFDAETEDDMRRIAACGRAAPGPVLWCGSGGLGRALAGDAPVRAVSRLDRPVLGLFGSDQAVTRRQLAACGRLWLRLDPAEGAARLGAALADRGAALASLDLPDGLSRAEAAQHIAHGFAALLRDLPRPGTLLVAGGETLAAICATLGTTAIEANGLVGPGVPRSLLRGGSWDGLRLVSKSGAFGDDTLWRDLLAANGFIQDTLPA
jgi:uncharacterized protein YgbK (DUF1537 family)